MDDEKPKDEKRKLSAMSLATWARLRAAGKIAKPNGAEVAADNPDLPKKKKKPAKKAK